MTTFEQIEYGGWSKAFRLRNAEIELVITAEVGPRIIRLGYQGEQNLFCEIPATLGKSGGDDWRLYGGHRLWLAPEHRIRTYQPDNAPVEITENNGLIRVIQPPEPATGIQKELDIRLSDDANHVTVTHRLRNHNLWAVEVSPWALSVMKEGGTAIVPLHSYSQDSLPVNNITLWGYSNISDSRLKWGRNFVMMQQQLGNETPNKIGLIVTAGWAAYVVDGYGFIKRFPYHAGAVYPDMESSLELFTNETILEIETLGPLAPLAPGGTVEHSEDWYVFKDVFMPGDEASVEAYVLPLVEQTR